MSNDPLPWRVIGRRHVLRDRWLSVRADDCETADGTSVAPYYILEYPDWVQIVAIDRQDCLVMVRQYRHGLGAVSLEIPCGGIEPGDGDPIAAARRELHEETGYASDRRSHVASLSPNPASPANRCHVLLALDAESATRPANDPREDVRPLLVPVAEAIAVKRTGGMAQAMPVAALTLALGSIGRW